MMKGLKLGLLSALALLLATQAHAGPLNEPPPSGPVVLNLNGTSVPHSWTSYTTPDWTATSTTTNMSFAFREDPAFLGLASVTVRDVTTNTNVPVLNGDFSLGVVGQSAPVDWTYLNTFGAIAGGRVEPGSFMPGSGATNIYFDGAVGAYDAITQAIGTVVGNQYTISFQLNDSGGLTTFSNLSTNGRSGTAGNGINLVVYAGVGQPTLGAPEPSSITLAGLGFVALLGYARRRRLTAAA